MKCKRKLITVITMASAFLYLMPLSAEKGYEIMKKVDALPEAKTSKNESVLAIIKGKNIEKKKFTMLSKKYGKKTRSRLSFTYPTRIKFLTWSAPGKNSTQWIKLSSGSVRKIASSDKSSSFVNSHFYYEDIATRDIDDYKYKYLGAAKADGVACYKVQSIKKKGTKVYSKSIIYVRKKDYVVVQIDFYEKGRHTKTLKNKKIEKINGIFTPRKMVMQRTDGKGKSLLYLRSVKYNIKVSDQMLKRETL